MGGLERIFYGLDPDGYEVMFEEHRPVRSRIGD
jgi:hypothetical protein